jgi:hypothetical protein
LPQLPDVELVAVANEESDPAAQTNVLKNRYAAKAHRYETLTQLMAAEQLDLVAVCNHNGGGLRQFWRARRANST